jgi:hypothetical protein
MQPTPVLTPSSETSSSVQEKFPVREWTFSVPGLQDHVSFNPLVSGIGISVLWGLAIWSMVVSLPLVSFESFRNRIEVVSILGILSTRYTNRGSSFVLNGLAMYKKTYAHARSPFYWSIISPRQQDPAGSNSLLVDWRASVTLYFTWLFIGCRAVFFFFIVFIGFKFSHVKLGHKDEPPEFSTAAFFSMIFA